MNARPLVRLLAPAVSMFLVPTLGTAFGQTATAVRSVTISAARPATAPAALPNLPETVFASVPGSPPTTATAKPEDVRLQKINRLTFDRRPSAILEASSAPADQAAQTKDETGPRPTTPGTPTAATPDPFDQELKDFQRKVTLGRWGEVKASLAKLPEDQGNALYRRLLGQLPDASAAARPMPVPAEPGGPVTVVTAVNPQMAQFGEKNAVSNGDVLALADAAPHGLDDEAIAALGRLLRASLDQGHAVEDFVARAKEVLQPADGEPPLTRREVARVLAEAGCAVEAGDFLPDVATAEMDDDREALNLLSRHALALYARDKKPAHLERAWAVTQAVLAVGPVDRDEEQEALKRAVELAPKVRAELGRAWLDESFTARPERGLEVLAAIGASASRGLVAHAMDTTAREKTLELQKTAVEALLAAAPDKAPEWRRTLSLLAAAWLTEAEFSHRFDQSTSLGPRLQRDPFGNIYYVNSAMEPGMPGMMPQQRNMPRPIPVARILEARPGDAWLDQVDEGLRPRFATVLAELYLKVNEEDTAFPFIEQLAATHPEKARALAEEFLRVWTTNHDPNAARNRTNPYMFIFGFERKAEGIPLTRSKQERNLEELSEWVARLRALEVGAIDEALLARAFTTCHSAAEVYRLEAIESVFGSLDGLKPETLAELIQQMRANLVGVWRQPAVQEKEKTRRKEKDIRAEVLRGYEVARAVIERGLREHPEHWALVLARASVRHDENNYRQEIDPSSDFARLRREALADFALAARRYAGAVGDLSEDEETAKVYETWFYAGLGACDLNQIDEETQPDPRQPALIREAILALPGEAAERHLAKFANALFTRMSGLNPAVKFRYLRGGFEIVGDHPQAHEARKVYDYYKDLVSEITLDAAIDGLDEVGHDRPFGVFVNLRHTREIERESGGFGRYLQNQKQGGNVFYYNYGRPLENYRDKFRDAAQEALGEHFEVLSVTFEDEKVHSRASSEYGWRITPYAYLLLKARGPGVDALPPLRLDLDFLDTSGYVVLPVETPRVPLDAAPGRPPGRPYRDLEITQTLDERQADEGKLILEVKAVAKGLVPELGEILDVRGDGFEVTGTEDQGLSVSKFDPDSEAPAVLSERSWLVTLQAPDGQSRPPEVFRFASARGDDAKMTYQRYVDADLAEVGPEVALEARYGRASRAWIGWAVGLSLLTIAAAALAWALRSRGPREEPGRFTMPEAVTPFTVLGLLRDIQQNDGLPEPARRELAASIHRLEVGYFTAGPAEETDLRGLAETWLHRAR